jgi:hypothetical protein
MKKIIFNSAFIFLCVSCSKLETSKEDNSSPAVNAEISECLTSTAYNSPAVITGTAVFYKRGLKVTEAANQVTRLILGAPITTPLPIRFAEIRVLDSAGNVIQCGKTNTLGLLKAVNGTSDLEIPSTAGSYTVEVLSRSNQNMAVSNSKPVFKSYVAVKEDIYSNSIYKVSSSVTTTGTGSFSTTLTATALESTSSKIEGGAFNIYNDLITTYEYLADLPDSNINLTCLNPKLDIYWKAGFNPAKYLYPTESEANLGTLSFYLRGESELYINGGVVGNVTTADTDHFDDAVIIHEIGHHIEHVCGTMDSPGGSHSGRYRIDPRLAWSEGWGNFIGAHIIRNKISNISPLAPAETLPNNEWLFYYDSQGYNDGVNLTGYEYIRINLARPGNSTTESLYTDTGTGSVSYDPVNPTTFPGESHTREVSVARGLFKGTNTCTAPMANCVNSTYFADYWKAFENRTAGIGMGKSIYPFRSSIRFISRLKAVQSGTLAPSLVTLFTTDEALQPDDSTDYTSGGFKIWVPYAINLIPSGGPCNLKIQPAASSGPANGLSDQRYANHFYTVDLTLLTGVTSIQISGVTPGNAKIQILQDGYQFNEGSLTASSVNLSGLSSSQKYLLNIRLNSGAESTYTLTDQSGGNLCPASSL